MNKCYIFQVTWHSVNFRIMDNECRLWVLEFEGTVGVGKNTQKAQINISGKAY